MNSEDKNWKKLEGNTDDDLSKMINISGISKIRSQNPLLKIKRNLLINIIWGLLICCAYVTIIICFNYWQVRLAIAIVLGFSLWALATAYIQFTKIDTKVFANSAVLNELKRQHQSIISWIRSQSRVALFIYPVSGAGGFMLGGAIGSGKSVAVFMSKPLVWLLFVVVVAILTPICHQLAKWMSKKSFGEHLYDLQKNIEELETEK